MKIRALGPLALCVLAALTSSVSADGYPNPQGSGYPNHGSGYPNPHGSGYPSGHSGGYPSGGGPNYGGQGGYYPNFNAYYYPIPIQGKKLTEVDKLFARLADVDAELHILQEALSSAQARLVLGKRFVDELSVVVDEGADVDDTQNKELETLNDIMDDVQSAVNTGNAALSTVDPLNAANTDGLMTEGARLAMAIADDTEQQGELARLGAEIPLRKNRLLTKATDCFMALDLTIVEEIGRANTVQALTRSRQCETGTVTLHRDDRRAEAIFQTNFGDDIPQVLYGIAGYEFNLQAREQSSNFGGFGGGFGGGYSTEPNAVGVFVSANPSPDSVTFQATNLGFGDSSLTSVKINYQACNIGPDPF